MIFILSASVRHVHAFLNKMFPFLLGQFKELFSQYVLIFFNFTAYCPIAFASLGVCVYSNSRNDVPRVAQRYGTIAAHTRRRASVLVLLLITYGGRDQSLKQHYQ